MVRIKEKGRTVMSPVDPEQFVVPDLAAQLSELEGSEDLAPDDKIRMRDEIYRAFQLVKRAFDPDGLANRSGLVGKYLCGHRNVAAQVALPLELFPGLNVQHSLVSKKFMRPGPLPKYVRHDLRVWESSYGRDARLRNDAGQLLFGDAMLADWRTRARTGAARVRAYYDVLPARESELTLSPSARNGWGDPMPHLDFRDAKESAELRGHTEDTIRARFRELARAGDGRVISSESDGGDIGQEHPGGGCRMGKDPSESVVDEWGRAHDHANLFVAGAPTNVTASCCNGTLTFAALGLRVASKIGTEFSAR